MSTTPQTFNPEDKVCICSAFGREVFGRRCGYVADLPRDLGGEVPIVARKRDATAARPLDVAYIPAGELARVA